MASKISFLKKNHQFQEIITIGGAHFCFEVKYKKLQYLEKDFSLIFQAYYNFLEQKYKHSISDIITPVAETYLKLLSAHNAKILLFRLISNFKAYNNPKLKPEIEQEKVKFLAGTEDIVNQYNDNLLDVDSDKLDEFEKQINNGRRVGYYVIFEKYPEYFPYDIDFDYNKETITDLAKVRVLLATEVATIKNYFDNEKLEELYQVSVSDNEVTLFNLFLNIYYNDRSFIHSSFKNIESFAAKHTDTEEFKQFCYHLSDVNKEFKKWRLVDKVFNERAITTQDVSILAKQYKTKTSIIYLALYFSNEIIKNKWIWLEESLQYKKFVEDEIERNERMERNEKYYSRIGREREESGFYDELYREAEARRIQDLNDAMERVM